MFILSLEFLEDEIFDWYEKLGKKKISSLSYFFRIFLENWSPLYEIVKFEGVALEKLMDQNCLWSFETSNISSGGSTHYQGNKKLICCKRVLRHINRVKCWKLLLTN
jgi:hypothetical protein